MLVVLVISRVMAASLGDGVIPIRSINTSTRCCKLLIQSRAAAVADDLAPVAVDLAAQVDLPRAAIRRRREAARSRAPCKVSESEHVACAVVSSDAT